METLQSNEIVFAITKEDLQYEAKERIGRELSEDEILDVKKRLEYGIGESIGIIYQTILTEIIKK
ncbi:MAG: hypothetical protein AABX78_01535 [Nanoarchaeota archaeon]